jgi:thiol-disulfide isomerase/thioredoxin
MKPVVDRLSSELEDEVEFRLYNLDQDPDASAIADEFDVRYVPTFIFVGSDGEIVDTRVGTVPEDELRSILESLE